MGDSSANCIAFSPDGRSVAVGLGDGSVRMWDIEAGQQTLSIHAHSGQLEALAFTPDSRMMVTVGGDNYIRRWQADSSENLPE
jgi:WD40 repeat protein